MSNQEIRPETLHALGMLHHACEYVRERWSFNLDPAEAKANLNARAILFNCANRILREHGCGITEEEVEGARILERHGGEL